MKISYPPEIKAIANVLLIEIEKYFPGTTKKCFDGWGYPDKEGNPAQHRAEICLYIELIKAGAFNKELK